MSETEQIYINIRKQYVPNHTATSKNILQLPNMKLAGESVRPPTQTIIL